MEKWRLLRRAINGNTETSPEKASVVTTNGINNTNSNYSSIHRFQGFQHLINTKNLVWPGFCFRSNIQLTSKIEDVNNNANRQNISEFVINYFQVLNESDASHITVKVGIHKALFQSFKESVSDYNHASSANFSIDVQPVETNSTDYHHDELLLIQLLIVNLRHTPLFKQCRYLKHSFAALNKSDLFTIYTRENSTSSNARVNIKGLLSNKIHGIDNTGNICVWPSENILLHTIINHPTYLTQWFQNKCVLELGGGMTAFCGLALAMALKNCCKAVIVTDGHPDCVRNQRFCIRMNNNKAENEMPVEESIIHNDDSTKNLGKTAAKKNKTSTMIESHQLRWSVNDENGDLHKVMQVVNDMMMMMIRRNSKQRASVAENIGHDSCSVDSGGGSIVDHNTNRSYNDIHIYSTTTTTNDTNKNTSINATNYYFDVIIACDVLFFSEFHDALIYVLRHALRPPPPVSSSSSVLSSCVPSITRRTDEVVDKDAAIITDTNNALPSTSFSSSSSPSSSAPNIDNDDSGGVVLLLQPRRGKTMDYFITKASPYFHITIEDNYNTQVTECRKAYQKTQSATQEMNASGKPFYDEDIHYAILLILKLRHSSDTSSALNQTINESQTTGCGC